MGKLEWDKIGERRYETGVDHVVLYKNNGNSAYAWNGITGITENPSGAEPSILWANNKKYVYEALGIPITKESLIAGWVRAKIHEQFRFEIYTKTNGVMEAVLPDMELDMKRILKNY